MTRSRSVSTYSLTRYLVTASNKEEKCIHILKCRIASGRDQINQLENIGVVTELQDPDLSEDSLSFLDLVTNVGDLLDCQCLVRNCILNGDHSAISSLA